LLPVSVVPCTAFPLSVGGEVLTGTGRFASAAAAGSANAAAAITVKSARRIIRLSLRQQPLRRQPSADRMPGLDRTGRGA
jgi:hypothetical protein